MNPSFRKKNIRSLCGMTVDNMEAHMHNMVDDMDGGSDYLMCSYIKALN